MRFEIFPCLAVLVFAGLTAPSQAQAQAETAVNMLEGAVSEAASSAKAGAEFYIGLDGLELVGHTGDTMGYLSFAFAIPDYQATMIGHINADRDGVFVKLLRDTAVALRTACASEEAN